MDRRNFILTLFGGLAAASVGGLAVAEAASPAAPKPVPVPEPARPDQDLPAETAEALDKTDSEYSQYYY